MVWQNNYQVSRKSLSLETGYHYMSLRSSAKLSYIDAQALIDTMDSGHANLELPYDDSSIKFIQQDLRLLHSLAKQLRERRFANGVLSIHSDRLKFALDSTGSPVDCAFYQRESSSKLVEEVS